MNWRRGLLLAGVHLAVAVPLIVWQESFDWSNLSDNERSPQQATLRLIALQEEQAVPFDPCKDGSVDGSLTPQYLIVSFANLPASLVSGWGESCPRPWTVAGIMHKVSAKELRMMRLIVATILCALIFVQWSIIGGIPLVRPKRWWFEPMAFITICTLAAFALVPIPGIRELSPFIMLFAALGWLYWFGLFVWKISLSGWGLATSRVARSH